MLIGKGSDYFFWFGRGCIYRDINGDFWILEEPLPWPKKKNSLKKEKEDEDVQHD